MRCLMRMAAFAAVFTSRERIDWFIDHLYLSKGFFAPPFETGEPERKHRTAYPLHSSNVQAAIRLGNSVTQQDHSACEIEAYLKNQPNAIVVEMGASLSCLRRQMGNATNRWYCLEMAHVIELREKHIPKGEREKNIVWDANNFSWFDRIPFDPKERIIFPAGGLFCYFQKEQVRKLFCTMGEHFPGRIIIFDRLTP